MLQEDIDGRGNRSDQFNYLIDFALYYAGKRAIAEVRQIFSFLPGILTYTYFPGLQDSNDN